MASPYVTCRLDDTSRVQSLERRVLIVPIPNNASITLLNVDYKLATKCIARRFEKVLPHLIESDQTGYIKGRYLGENIGVFSDIIEQHENKGGMILFLDFKKPLTP